MALAAEIVEFQRYNRGAKSQLTDERPSAFQGAADQQARCVPDMHDSTDGSGRIAGAHQGKRVGGHDAVNTRATNASRSTARGNR
jgi:hypothetical protein